MTFQPCGEHFILVVLLMFVVLFIGLLLLEKFYPSPDVPEGITIINNLERKHDLRKLSSKDVTYSESSSEWSGGFFLVVGSASGESHSKTVTKTMITFAWKNENGEYIVSSLPIDQVRFAFSENLENPTVSFRCKQQEAKILTKGEYSSSVWSVKPTDRLEMYGDNVNRFLNQTLAYAVITCKPSDWPADVKLPLQ